MIQGFQLLTGLVLLNQLYRSVCIVNGSNNRLLDDTIQNKPVEMVAAIGNGDQRIYFDKINDLLVVVTAGNYNQWDIKNNSSVLLRKIYESISIK